MTTAGKAGHRGLNASMHPGVAPAPLVPINPQAPGGTVKTYGFVGTQGDKRAQDGPKMVPRGP